MHWVAPNIKVDLAPVWATSLTCCLVKIKFLAELHSFWGPGGEPIPLCFPASRNHAYSLAHSHLLLLNQQWSVSFFSHWIILTLTFSLLFFTSKDICDQHDLRPLIIQESLSTFRSVDCKHTSLYNFSHLAVWCNINRLQGLEHGNLWGPFFCLVFTYYFKLVVER